MEFAEAKRFVMPLGKYKGRSLMDIAGDDDGLRYLDWLAGQDWVNGRLQYALEVYLTDPSIARDLESAIGGD